MCWGDSLLPTRTHVKCRLVKLFLVHTVEFNKPTNIPWRCSMKLLNWSGLGLDAPSSQRLFTEGGMKSFGVRCSSYPLLCNKLSQTCWLQPANIFIYHDFMCKEFRQGASRRAPWGVTWEHLAAFCWRRGSPGGHTVLYLHVWWLGDLEERLSSAGTVHCSAYTDLPVMVVSG